MDRWPQDRCRWIWTDALGGDDVARDPPVGTAGTPAPGTSRWVYVCNRQATGDLFPRYRRRRQRVARRSEAALASAEGRPETGACFVLRRRACPRCNGWVYRVPRHFVDGLKSVLAPVHRYRCRSLGCCWEGNLSVRRAPELKESVHDYR